MAQRRVLTTARRAFTIMELLIVMIVITLVISILLPALGSVRTTARKTTTTGLLNEIISAAQRFSVDKKRLPGYFSAREMGGQENFANKGLSAMENVMLDLAGGIVGTGLNPVPNTLTINPTPTPDRNVYVDPDQIGTTGAYYMPPRRHFVAQTNDGPGGIQQFGVAGHTAATGTDSLPDVLDAWSAPLLAWVQDETALAAVSPPNTFIVKDRLPNTNDPSARFYWASNAAFLRADSLGKRARNQVFQSPDSEYSLIGQSAPNLIGSNGRAGTLESALGNPNYPWKAPGGGQLMAPAFPSAGRAPFIVHSAGADGYYFGSKDRGAKAQGGTIDYSYTFWSDIGFSVRNTDKNGQPTNEDVLRQFDDVLATSTN